MSNSYQRLPQSDDETSRPTLAPPVSADNDTTAAASGSDADRSYRPLRESIRSEFNRPPPATWKRVLLVLAVLLMGYVAVKLGGYGEKKPQVIYASRSVFRILFRTHHRGSSPTHDPSAGLSGYNSPAIFILLPTFLLPLPASLVRKPKIPLTRRYSEEHRYRPAASPVITEYLKDGRIRLRGASPGGVGVREEDLPMSKERKAVQEKKRVEEAKAAAAKMLKEKRQAIKEKRSARKAKKRGGKALGKSEI